MAYTVLARKYRSQSFDDVIGQEPIATTLANAIRTGRIHHGYLFTGTRGVGKTSMARILAKGLNCLKADGPTVKPCCACDACKAIAEGQDIDVVEIDAASNTGVDNIRELRGNTAYRPARSRFKIYIIDEVHMLSTGAFNALLKTLEEPPEHVKFILATTEIQKVPATIQSRCQRYVFRNIGPDDIAKRLDSIVKDEGAKADPAVLRRIARLAAGSMRDALSILDQLMSVSPTNLTTEALDELLPPPQDEQILKLLGCAAEGDVPGVLKTVETMLDQGRGLDVFCNDMIETLRTLMLLRACGPEADSVDVPAAARNEYVELAGRFELSHYVQIIGMMEELRRNVRFSGAGRALTDALMVRLANLRRWTPIETLLARAAGGDGVDQKKKPEPPGPVAPPASAARVPAVASPPITAASAPSATTVASATPAAAARAVVEAPAMIAATAHATGSAGVQPARPDATAPSPTYASAAESWVRSAPPPAVPAAAVAPAPPAAAAASAPLRTRAPREDGPMRPATVPERQRILNDPLLQSVIDLCDGEVRSVLIQEPRPVAEEAS